MQKYGTEKKQAEVDGRCDNPNCTGDCKCASKKK